MPEQLALAQFQRWMAAVVTHFGSDEEAWKSEAASQELSYNRAMTNVIPNKHLSEYERIGIYRKMYFLRMRDALAIDVPAVRHFLGADVFEEVVEEYFTRFPSTSYTLNDSGLNFPRYVRESTLQHKDFIAELAELELAIARVMEAEETAPLSPEELAGVPPEAWENAQFKPIAAFELFTFTFPVHEYLSAFEAESETFPQVTPTSEFGFIHRAEYSTNHYSLQESEFLLLRSLSAGTPLAQAFEAVQESFVASLGEEASEEAVINLQNRISTCFQQWIAMGIFAEFNYEKHTS